ncbi:electron transfer flavoprotein beta subunit [Anaerobacterium chartisolvens]|uniref:Electron transfer flavoprotein subunit beta n=1 Tax=Anaerobacterium chartisolvens TaxID=1297424 RepID=A0A369B456_9FIRM|nr:electron transfer flavoprotein subunit beta/FixA family protein [Anaerobacterium chartisolvens]RCX16329.1 electron transfer flavoprotein beta subunit [Anaerobacterium chartisolvens]
MRIGVCIKEVLDTNCSIRLNLSNNRVATEGQKHIVNPYDEFALEEALRLKEKNSDVEIITFTIGPERARESIYAALAAGADNALHVVMEDSILIDSLGIALIIQKLIEKEKIDMLLLGEQSTDYSSHEVGPMVAGLLGWAQAMGVSKLEINMESVLVSRETEESNIEIIKLNKSCIIGVTKGINVPRYATLKGIMSARKKNIIRLQIEDLGLNNTELTGLENEKFFYPPEKGNCTLIEGDPKEAAAELVRILKFEERLL